MRVALYDAYIFNQCAQKRCIARCPHTNRADCFELYGDKIGQNVEMDVYDCFGGTVKILAVEKDRVLIEVVEAYRCYSCQQDPTSGEQFWIDDWLIADCN